MRVLLVILALAATPAAAVIFWVHSHPPPPPPALREHSIVWADRVFTNPKALRRWLHVRGQRYAVWARKHPSQAASLEHRSLPTKSAPARTAAKPAGRDGTAETALGILAALLALTGTAAVVQRVHRRTRLRRPRISLPTISV